MIALLLALVIIGILLSQLPIDPNIRNIIIIVVVVIVLLWLLGLLGAYPPAWR